jgi:MFS family permease
MKNKPSMTSVLFQREFLAVLIVVVNVFSWYFPMYIFFESTLKSFQMGHALLEVALGTQFAAAVGFAIIGTAFVKKFLNRDSILTIWMFIGIISSLLMATLETFSIEHVLLVSFLLGTSLGFGFPSCLAYFGDNTNVENRGLLGGITFGASGLFILIFGLTTSLIASILVKALILAAWRGIGLISFLVTKRRNVQQEEKPIKISYKSVLQDRSFLLYFLPWTIFCLINFLEAPIVIDYVGDELASYMPIVEYSIGGLVALIGGWFADSVGRKSIIIIGFVTMGIGFAILGLFQGMTEITNGIKYLYIGIDGVAWGIFSLMFYLVIWSELAGKRIKEKYYLLGVAPFLIASYIQILFTPYAKDIPISAAFSLASFFLFLAVLPLLYAPETMPQKQIEMKRLRKFADDAKEAKEKYERLGI